MAPLTAKERAEGVQPNRPSRLPAGLKRYDRLLVPNGSRGTQAAVVSHVSAGGNVYACKWLARGRRWTRPVQIWEFCGHGHGKHKPEGSAPLKMLRP